MPHSSSNEMMADTQGFMQRAVGGCIARRTSFLRIVFKVLRLVYYCASVGADFYSFSYRTSCDLVARDQNLSPLAQPGFWR